MEYLCHSSLPFIWLWPALSSLIPASIHNIYMYIAATCTNAVLSIVKTLCAQMFSTSSVRLGLQVSEFGSTGYTCNLWRAQRRWDIFSQDTVICRQQICALVLNTLAFIILVAVSAPWVAINLPRLQGKGVILNSWQIIVASILPIVTIGDNN